MKIGLSVPSFLGSLFCLMIAAPSAQAAAPLAHQAGSIDDQTREQLMTFFANAPRHAPTAFGQLPQDSESTARLRQRIDALGPEELASLRAALSAVPDWQTAPEALSSAFQMQVLGEEAKRGAVDLGSFRTDVSELYAVMRLMPPDALGRFNQDAASIADVQARIHEMPEASLALLQLEMEQLGDWRALKASLLSSLPPEAQAGLRALADKGPLQESDLTELGAFRRDLEDFIAHVKALPPHLAAGLTPRAIAGLAAKLDAVTPEMLFMIRPRIDTPALRQAMSDVRLLARAGTLTEEEKSDLEEFRSSLTATYGVLGEFAPGGEGALAARLAALSPEQLLLARRQIESIPSWEQTLPAIFGAVSTPDERRHLALLDEEPAARRSLDLFRDATLARLAELEGAPGIDPSALDEAARAVEEATSLELFLMHGAISRMTGENTLIEIIDVPIAVARLSGPQSAVSFNCPCIDIVVACVPVQGLCDILEVPINAAIAGIQAVVNGLETTVQSLSSVIQGIPDVLATVVAEILALPSHVVDGFLSIFNLIRDAALGILTPENIAATLGLVDGFWNSIPDLPQIPCPEDNFDLHPFGLVGEEETASKYERYLFAFNKLIDLIPDTETSLALRLPTEALFGGLDYLGVCLRDAATQRSEIVNTAFRNMVVGKLDTALVNQGSLGAGIGLLQAQVAGVGAHLLEFQDLELRLAIETNLGDQGLPRVSTFRLPQAFGGELERVRQIVWETIQAALAAMLDVGNAEMKLANGDAQFAAGHYGRAYEAYAQAYRDAARGRAPGDNDDDSEEEGS